MLFTLIEKSLSGVRKAAVKQEEKSTSNNVTIREKQQALHKKRAEDIRALQQRITEVADKSYADIAALEGQASANNTQRKRCGKIIKAIDSVTNDEVTV